jgi:CRP-like cAMP-binding protein
MAIPPNTPETARRNRLLAALPTPDLDRLLAALDPVPLPLQQVLFRAGEPFEYIHFPIDGIVSLTGSVENEPMVEIAMIGNEGLVGLSAFLETNAIPLNALVQVQGNAMRMRVAALEQEIKGGALNGILRRYTQALFNQVAQGAVCNRLHSMEERLARWLLMSHDRVQTPEFPLTQEFMARMLGVRRATVNETASALQQAGLIRYNRGRVAIVDPERLKETSCECYCIIKRGYDQMFEKSGPAFP